MSGGYTGADLFVDALSEYGVSRVFGNPGTTELPVLDALSESEVEYVLGLHEDIAVGMAAGYASMRRYQSHHSEPDAQPPVGVVNLHITPGVAHGLGNLYAAKHAGTPVVLTAGNHELDFRHEEPLLSGDLQAMTEQFTKESWEVTSVDALPLLLRRAFRTALTPPTGPVFLALPMDVMLTETSDSPERLGSISNSGSGDPAQLAGAADLLATADDPVLVVGDHVARAGATDNAVALAEATGARVHGEILACEVNFPSHHEQWISYLPPSESLASMLMSTDLLVLIGCSSNTTLLRHEDDLVGSETTCIQISNAAREIGTHQPADVAVIGDPGLVMDDLATRTRERIPEETRTDRLESVKTMKQSLSGTIESLGVDEPPEAPDAPQVSKADLVDAMREVVPDATIVDESVTSKFPLLTRWPMEKEQLLSNKGGGLGYGLPASVGAALAERERADPRDVIGFIGDGSYLYYPHAIYTAARYGLDLTVVIPDNRNYRILKDNTNTIFGGGDEDHTYVGMDFDPPVDIVANAESHGARGHLVEEPEALESVLERATSRSGTDVVDVFVHD